jgi:iron complex outermembrane receptor protein
MVNSPLHMVKGRLIIPLLSDKLFASPELQYMSDRSTLGGNRLPGFMVANLTIFSQKLLDGLELSGSAYNLFDKRYHDPSGEELIQDSIEQDGRTFRVKLTYRF